MKDKSRSHFADIGLSGGQVGTPAGLISVSEWWVLQEPRCSADKETTPALRKEITLYVIKGAALVSPPAGPVTSFCVLLKVKLDRKFLKVVDFFL